MLQRVCNELSWNYVEMNISGSEYVRRNKVDMLSYQDPDMEIVRTLEDFVGFHIIRDPRDIVVSAYFSHLHSHATDNWPELSAYRAELQKLSKDDGLLLEMEFLRREFKQLYEWDYAQENVLELKMEDVVANPYDQIVRALLFIDAAAQNTPLKSRLLAAIASGIRDLGYLYRIPSLFVPNYVLPKLPVEFLLGYIYENRFSEMAKGRARGIEDACSHYRKGVAGDWVNHFKPQHKEYFKKNYNDVLLKLGYESTSDW
ncbi:MAG: hypothetical protein WB662_02920 [Methyloceanibacter sp.]